MKHCIAKPRTATLLLLTALLIGCSSPDKFAEFCKQNDGWKEIVRSMKSRQIVTGHGGGFAKVNSDKWRKINQKAQQGMLRAIACDAAINEQLFDIIVRGDGETIASIRNGDIRKSD